MNVVLVRISLDRKVTYENHLPYLLHDDMMMITDVRVILLRHIGCGGIWVTEGESILHRSASLNLTWIDSFSLEKIVQFSPLGDTR